MARTRIKGSNIEDHSIKNEDIALSGGLDASKIISGTTLPALDASQLLNTLNSISDNSIPFQKLSDNSIPLSKLSTTNAGTTGQVLIRDGNGEIELVDAHTVIADDSIPLTKLFTANSGTAGQLLKKNASGELEFVDEAEQVNVSSTTVGGTDISGTINNLQINDDVINIAKLDVSDGLNGQALMTDGSGNLSFGNVATNSDPTLGGALSGTASNAQLNNDSVGSWAIQNGSISNSKITDLDAAKLTGTIPHNVQSGGELGYANYSLWQDNIKHQLNLNHSADDIGKIVVKVYEEYNDPANENIVSNQWDVDTGTTGFEGLDYENSYNDSSGVPQALSVTPAATTGTEIMFTFSGTQGQINLVNTNYRNLVNYTISNTNGNGKGVIKSWDSGDSVSVDITEDWDNTSATSFRLDAGLKQNDNFVLSSRITDQLVGHPSLQAQLNPNSFNNNSNETQLVNIDDTRALMVYHGEKGGTPTYGVAIVELEMGGGGSSYESWMHIVGGEAGQTTNDMPYVENFFSHANLSANHTFAEIHVTKINDTQLACVANVSGGKVYTCIVTVPATASVTQSIQVQDAFECPYYSQARYPTVSMLGPNNIMVIANENNSNCGGYIPMYQMGYIGTTGIITWGNYGYIGAGPNQSDYSMPNGMGYPQHPIHHLFGAEDPNQAYLKSLYIYYMEGEGNAQPRAVVNNITRQGGDEATDICGYAEYVTPYGAGASWLNAFRNSDGLSTTASGGDNRVAGKYKHCLVPHLRTDPSNNNIAAGSRATYFWIDSQKGLESCVVSINAPNGGNLNSSSNRPVFFGRFTTVNNSQTGEARTNIQWGGPATNVVDVSEGVPSSVTATQISSGGISGSDEISGLYMYRPGNMAFYRTGKFTSSTVYDTEVDQYTDVAFESASLTKTTTGAVDRLISTTCGLKHFQASVPQTVLDDTYVIQAHNHGDNNMYGRVIKMADIQYVTNEWVTILSRSGIEISTDNWKQINSITATENLSVHGQTSYMFSTNLAFGNGHPHSQTDTGTFFIFNGGGGIRNVISNQSSITGGAQGEWYYNSSSSTNETWERASYTISDGPWWGNSNYENPQFAARLALTHQPANHMSANTMNNFANSVWQTIQLKANFPYRLYTLMAMKTTNPANSPTIDKLVINYDLDGAVHRDKTQEYTIDIVDLNTIEVTSPSSGGPRNARIYVTS